MCCEEKRKKQDQQENVACLMLRKYKQERENLKTKETIFLNKINYKNQFVKAPVLFIRLNQGRNKKSEPFTQLFTNWCCLLFFKPIKNYNSDREKMRLIIYRLLLLVLGL